MEVQFGSLIFVPKNCQSPRVAYAVDAASQRCECDLCDFSQDCQQCSVWYYSLQIKRPDKISKKLITRRDFSSYFLFGQNTRANEQSRVFQSRRQKINDAQQYSWEKIGKMCRSSVSLLQGRVFKTIYELTHRVKSKNIHQHQTVLCVIRQMSKAAIADAKFSFLWSNMSIVAPIDKFSVGKFCVPQHRVLGLFFSKSEMLTR